MFNPEKLLGGLLMGSGRRGGLNRLVSGSVGLGLLGVAMEAADHFMKKSQVDQTGGQPQAPPANGHMAPSTPPPAPGATPPPPSEPPTMPDPAASFEKRAEKQRDTKTRSGATLLLRAMIAAANADSVIDEQERSRILNKFESMDLSEEEHSFIVKELLSPGSLDQIVSQVDSSETAVQIYSVSLMAIEVDTDAERSYMDALARRLNITDEKRNLIHEKLGVKILP